MQNVEQAKAEVHAAVERMRKETAIVSERRIRDMVNVMPSKPMTLRRFWRRNALGDVAYRAFDATGALDRASERARQAEEEALVAYDVDADGLKVVVQ